MEDAVSHELASHGGDAQATLAATVDGRSLDALGGVAGEAIQANLAPGQLQGGHVMLETLSPNEADNRERYTLTHLHAKGGMGRVWLARDGALGRQIALKELRPDQSDNSIVCSRFLYEAKITAQLEHPGIVPVYELGEGDAPYYTMRFVRGRTLSEAVRAYHKKRAAGEADLVGMVDLLSNFVSVCHAVAYAHSRGIIHRDLKGQNVVLGDFGEVIVLDWGLAKRVGPDQFEAPEEGPSPEDASPLPPGPEEGTAITRAAGIDDDFTLPPEPQPDDQRSPRHRSWPQLQWQAHHAPSSNGSAHPASSTGNRRIPESGAGPEGTMQGQLLGTPAYMAPEQAQGRHDLVDQRTDIYGLGAILYEILTGRPPFIAPKTSEVIRKVCQEAPIPPRQIVPMIAPGLEAVCLKALRKEKSQTVRHRHRTGPGGPALAGRRAGESVRRALDPPRLRVGAPAQDVGLRRRRITGGRHHRPGRQHGAGLRRTERGGGPGPTGTPGRPYAHQGQRYRLRRAARPSPGRIPQERPGLLRTVHEPGISRSPQCVSSMAEPTSKWATSSASWGGYRNPRPPIGRPSRCSSPCRNPGRRARGEAVAGPHPHPPGRSPGSPRGRQGSGGNPLRPGPGRPAHPRRRQERSGAHDRGYPAPGPDPEEPGRPPATQRSVLQGHDDLRPGHRRASAGDTPPTPSMPRSATSWPWRSRRADGSTASWAIWPRPRPIIAVPSICSTELVAEFPTVPRHRESLAKACNSLGILYQETGRLDEAEANLRREVPLVERLSQDFPDRPEYRRELARALNVFGGVLRLRGQVAEAEPILSRAIDLDTAIVAKTPDDVLVRFQLAVAHHHLGIIRMMQGNNAGRDRFVPQG